MKYVTNNTNEFGNSMVKVITENGQYLIAELNVKLFADCKV